MAQVRKGSTSSGAKKERPKVRRGGRKGGATAKRACTCQIELHEDDPIIAVSGAGPQSSFFRPNYAKEPACIGTECEIKIEYAWTLSDPSPAQPGGPLPVIDGDSNVRTVKVANAGTFKLKVEVRVRCARRDEGAAFRISKCSDSGEAEFEIR